MQVSVDFPSIVSKEELYHIESEIRKAYQLNMVKIMPHYPAALFDSSYIPELMKETEVVGIVARGFFEKYRFNLEDNMYQNRNHNNSNKKYLEQIRIAREVMHSRKYNPALHELVKGLMIESYLLDGSQSVDAEPHIFGKSITDPCLGWEKSEKLIYELAEEWI
jgi:hypothetical protein